MKHTQVLALSAVIAALSAGVSAQDHKFEARADAGRVFFDEALEDANTWGLGVGYVLNENWTLEAVASKWDSETQVGAGDIDGTQYRLDLIYNINTESAWRPFVAFGLGDQKRESNFAPFASERDTLLNLGTGVKRSLGNNWEFRTDLRAFNSLDNEYTDLSLTAGIAYLFGGSPAPVKVVAPAPAPAPVAVVDKDSDGDGVLDSQDQCPDTVSGLKVDAVGCPVVLEKTLVINLEILFDSAKSEVKDQYLPQVKKLADALTQYQNTVVTIEGHTDSQGADAFNKALSQSRADAVKASLVEKFGIAADRVTAIGYGEAQPIADNATAAGRAQNRRVVGAVSVKYSEEVKK